MPFSQLFCLCTFSLASTLTSLLFDHPTLLSRTTAQGHSHGQQLWCNIIRQREWKCCQSRRTTIERIPSTRRRRIWGPACEQRAKACSSCSVQSRTKSLPGERENLLQLDQGIAASGQLWAGALQQRGWPGKSDGTDIRWYQLACCALACPRCCARTGLIGHHDILPIRSLKQLGYAYAMHIRRSHRIRTTYAGHFGRSRRRPKSESYTEPPHHR